MADDKLVPIGGGFAAPLLEKPWGGEHEMPGRVHTCAWKGCEAPIPFAGFCPAHLAKVKTEPVDASQIKTVDADRPSAKNVQMLKAGLTNDDWITAEARESARFRARERGEVEEEQQGPKNVVPPPIVNPAGRPLRPADPPELISKPTVVAGELQVAMACYAALNNLSSEARDRVIFQVLDMFGLKPIPK